MRTLVIHQAQANVVHLTDGDEDHGDVMTYEGDVTGPDGLEGVIVGLVIGKPIGVVGVAWIVARLAWMGSAVVFVQGELAHAGYTARPPHVWPNSASEEAIRNLAQR